MADWFKFFENGLDEPRLQYAIGTLSEVTPVWVGILSECCRHKSDSIGWDDDEAYLFGFSRRLNVSVSKVNEAVNLLIRIRYIEIVSGKLKVLKWNDFQSEYMRKKARIPTDKVKALSDSVRTLSGHAPENVPLEERRKDEREYKKKNPTATLMEPDPLPIPANLNTQEFNNRWAVWMTVRRGKAKCKNWLTLFQSQLEFLSQYDAKTAAEILHNSIRNDYQGLIPPKNYGHAHQRPPAENPRNVGTYKPTIDYGEAARQKQLRQEQELAIRNGHMAEEVAQDELALPKAANHGG